MSRKSKSRSPPARAHSIPSHLPDFNERWSVPAICIFLAAIIWTVFGQTVRCGFVNLDDEQYVYENPHVTCGLNLDGITWAFTHFRAANWHPLTWISHMLDCQLYGLTPGGHHLTNVLLHTATTILLFLILRRMTGALWRSAFVAAAFAIHPIHVESVAWVSERKDVLSGLFFVLTLGAYVRYARLPWSPHRYLMVVLMYVLGLMSKPMLVTLPFVLMLLDYWPLGRLTTLTSRTGRFAIPPGIILEKLPLCGLAIASCLVTILAQQEVIKSLQNISFASRAGNAVISYIAYLRQTFWPADMAVVYPFPSGRVEPATVILCLVLLAGISAAVFLLRRQRPYLITGWLWFMVMLLPVIGLVQVGLQARADRYTYLPHIGLCIALTWAVADFCAGWRHRRLVLGGCFAAVLVALIFCARTQTSYWRNSETLWAHALACTSDNFVAHGALGDALVQQGRLEDASFHLQEALRIMPGYPEAWCSLGSALLQQGRTDEAIADFQNAIQIRPDYANAHFDLGLALSRKGDAEEAMVHFQKALKTRPDDTKARLALGNVLLQQGRVDEAIVHIEAVLRIEPQNADVQFALGDALLQQGRVDDAIIHFRSALKIRPNDAAVHCDIGAALFQKGNIDEAIGHFQKALETKPDLAEAHINLGSAFFKKRNVQEAIVHFQSALEVESNNVEAQNDLAWLLATSPQASERNGNRAVDLAERASQATGGENPMILGTLAAAYAEAGRFGDAQQSAQKAVELAAAAGRQDLVSPLTEELKLYQAGLPFHEAETNGSMK